MTKYELVEISYSPSETTDKISILANQGYVITNVIQPVSTGNGGYKPGIIIMGKETFEEMVPKPDPKYNSGFSYR